MYMYVLLLICSLTVAIDAQNFVWSLLKRLASYTHDAYVPEDARLTIKQLAQKYGYPLQEHTVTSEDGYILNIHRIPNLQRSEKPVVFLMHGTLESSDSWVLMGPDNALGYLLADQGYDVWMGNARGNKHALMHTTLDHTMSEYWQFTWEEIALFDLPAMIDYILEVTTQDILYYVGYSQGTTLGYVLCSMRPEYNDKIKVMFSLAPEAWMGNAKSPLFKIFSPTNNIWTHLLMKLNLFSAGTDFFTKVSAFFCAILSENCDHILIMYSGHEHKVNETFIPVILEHTPTGSSTLQFIHYGQLVISHRFCRYDFGVEGNMIRYGSIIPPDYDLSKVTVPVVLYYSSKDWFSDPEDVATLIQNLPNVNEYVFLNDFTHLDYVYATEAADVVYGGIIRKINEFDEYYYELDVKTAYRFASGYVQPIWLNPTLI